MIYKTYGKTGVKVSAVGFGGMRFDTKLSKEKNAELLLYAREKGITYFDTAPFYCEDQSEDIFGIALKQMGKDRENIYVSTKGMPTSITTADEARAAVEKSLQRLNLDKIDFYFVWCVRTRAHYLKAMKKGGQYEGLLKCKEEGLIDHIAISSHLRGPDIRQIIERDEFEGVLLGVNILNFPYRWEGVQKAYENGMGVLAMNPLAGGQIPKHAENLTFLGTTKETPTEAALRFCISCPQITVTLVGFTTKEQIDTASRVADTCESFAPADIDRIRKHIADGMDILCTGCGYCLKDTGAEKQQGCPENIPISQYMQFYNQKLLFGKSDEEMIKQIDDQYKWQLLVGHKAKAGDCRECGWCEQVCTQHLNIIERLREIAEWEKEAALAKPGNEEG